MRWLDKLERHFGFLAIPNLVLAVIAGQALSTLMGLSHPELPDLMLLDPAAVEAGQWYRLLTWIIVPDTSPLGVIFAIFWFQILWMIGRSLETEWGAFAATAYLLLGLAVPDLVSMFTWHYYHVAIFMSGWYFSTTLMLAFAALAPDFSLLLFFVLPVKMRWWAWAVGAYLVYKSTGGWVPFLEVASGTANYLFFFVPAGIQAMRRQRHALEGRKVFKAAAREAATMLERRCEVCRRGPKEAELRLCHCELCGEDGRNFCTEHLPEHLALTTPKKVGKPAGAKQKRKS